MDAIVLAGGKASRLGGIDKGALDIGGRTLLERALDATAGAASTVVVGPRVMTPREVKWAREDPPGGGPVAALAAGLELTSSEVVAVVAADLPHLERRVLSELVSMTAGRDGAILVDAAGRDQPLAGVYRAASLRARLRAFPSPSDVAMNALVEGLDLARVENDLAARDCDTPEDLETARATVKGRWSSRSTNGSSS